MDKVRTDVPEQASAIDVGVVPAFAVAFAVC